MVSRRTGPISIAMCSSYCTRITQHAAPEKHGWNIKLIPRQKSRIRERREIGERRERGEREGERKSKTHFLGSTFSSLQSLPLTMKRLLTDLLIESSITS